MTTRRQNSIYRRITELELLVERLERKIADTQAVKHEPIAYLGKTATTITAKAGNVMGSGDIYIWEVGKDRNQFDTAQRFKCFNYATTGSIASNKEVIVLRVGRTQTFVVIWELC